MRRRKRRKKRKAILKHFELQTDAISNSKQERIAKTCETLCILGAKKKTELSIEKSWNLCNIQILYAFVIENTNTILSI